MTLASAFPAWEARPEVWVLVVALVALGFYATRVIQPKAVAAGERPITRNQKLWFTVGVVAFWVAADYPMHDIAEQRLYSMHMIQHSLLLVVFPPAMLLATPTWLARLIIGRGGPRRFVHYWARPAPALLVNLGLTALSHSAWVVNTSVENGPLHYGVHILLVLSALLVWMPVCGPIPELQVGPPLKMVIVFLVSVIPTLPAAFLTAAETVLYQGYNHDMRLWGLSVEDDQQLAGVVMKVITGMYLWVIIAVIFFKWSLRERVSSRKYRGKFVPSPELVDSMVSAPSAPEDRSAGDRPLEE